ncbi:hypothetical protein OG592_02995 [Streptomyces avidinii]|uniref:hypothetical protein n=1 Tax=Streptomyces avidinii TaxID=1895 RepID=UPI003867DA6B|nr:hypothetical protein OG592_02995 [Streptomyces avidinii]
MMLEIDFHHAHLSTQQISAAPCGSADGVRDMVGDVDVLVLERRPGPVTESRATDLHARTLEACSPIGGQGLNLGLRDAVSLAAVLPAATARGRPVVRGADRLLAEAVAGPRPEWTVSGLGGVRTRWCPGAVG